MVAAKAYLLSLVSICMTTMLVECSVGPETRTAPLKYIDPSSDQYQNNPLRRMLRKGPIIIGIVPPGAYNYAPLVDVPFYYSPEKPDSRELYNPFLRSTVFGRSPSKGIKMKNNRPLIFTKSNLVGRNLKW